MIARTAESMSRRAVKAAGRAADSARNRRVKPLRQGLTGVWMVIMVLFFIQALFYAWCRVQCVDAGYGIDQAHQRQQALIRERNTLNIEMARLKSPERIEQIARTQLGLVMPNAEQTVTLP